FHYDPECSKVIIPQLHRFSRDLDRNRRGGSSQTTSSISVKRAVVATGADDVDEVSTVLEDSWLWSDSLCSKRQRVSAMNSTSSATALKNAASRFQPVTTAKDWQNRLPS
ncbi:hypothetical protein FOZ63_015239, partial [Perkinsus olseni]